MRRWHLLVLSTLVAGALAGGWRAADLAAQDEPDTPQAQQDQPTPGDRRGGIPRDWLEGDEAQPEARSRSFGQDGNDAEGEGFDEGVPEFRVRPGFRPPDDELFPPRSDWKLGVRAENTDTGVVVTRVVPGSAAAGAGLERGDRIFTVSGHQIGFVGRELFPLGHELQRRAGRRGEVLLLVQNVRGNELLNVDVRLDRSGRAAPAPRRNSSNEAAGGRDRARPLGRRGPPVPS